MTDASYLHTHVAWLRGRAADFDDAGLHSIAEDYRNRADRIDALLAESEPVAYVLRADDDAIREFVWADEPNALAVLDREARELRETGSEDVNVSPVGYTTPQPSEPEGS